MQFYQSLNKKDFMKNLTCSNKKNNNLFREKNRS